MNLQNLFESQTNRSEFSIGDPVIITGNVEYKGKTGDVQDIGRDGAFVVVNLYNYGPHSFHSTDVSYNDYADSDDEAEYQQGVAEGSLNEDLGSFKAAGIPDDFSRGLLKSVNLSNDAELKPIDGVPKAADFNSGIVINVLPNGDVIGMLKGDGRYGKIYQRMTMSGGKFQRSNVDNTKDAVKGMKKSGKFYKIDRSWFDGISRGEKPSTDPADVKARTTGDALAGALAGSDEEIYSYMNDTFMPRMKQQMEAMVDDIYANLRRLGNSRDNFRGSKTEQQQALDMAKAIENIADRGFNRSTMELFLRSMDKEHHGFASIPNNERELRDILKNQPNARAKWAKTVLDAARAHHDAVKNMIAAPVMNTLKGQGVAEGSKEDAVADFLARGGAIQTGKYHRPRKSEKTDYGSRHIGGQRDAVAGKAGKTLGRAAATNFKGGGKAVVGEKTEKSNDQPWVDPKLKRRMDYAFGHYAGYKDKPEAFFKWIMNSIDHSEQNDQRHEDRFERIERELDRLAQRLSQVNEQHGAAVANRFSQRLAERFAEDRPTQDPARQQFAESRARKRAAIREIFANRG